jgi:integrase
VEYESDKFNVRLEAAIATVEMRDHYATLRTALERAKIGDYIRPFHDGRHTSLTNAAAAGIEPTKLMALAGHSDFTTTQGYIDLAGEVFREEAGRLEERLFGKVGDRSRS